MLSDPKNDRFMNNQEDLPQTNLPGEDQKMFQDPGQDQNLEIMDFVIFLGRLLMETLSNWNFYFKTEPT